MDIKADWIVLLIGGCSGTGKSTLGPAIAHKYKAELGRVDDYRMALQSATKPKYHPELHFFISSPGVPKDGIWENPPEVLYDALLKVGKFVSSMMEVVIEHHLHTGNRIVLEGDGIIPEMVFRIKSKYKDKLRSVFLYESDRDFFFKRDMPAEEENSILNLEKMVIRTMHWLYGQWLVEEAGKRDMMIIRSRPWDTLYDRVISSTE